MWRELESGPIDLRGDNLRIRKFGVKLQQDPIRSSKTNRVLDRRIRVQTDLRRQLTKPVCVCVMNRLKNGDEQR